jgi:hypothetical protein
VSTIAGTKVPKPTRISGRIMSGLVIVSLLFEGAIRLVPWQVIIDGMNRPGSGVSETLARSLGLITLVCTLLYSVPPTSILGAILLTGYLGGVVVSHVHIDSPLFTHLLFEVYIGLMVWSAIHLRNTAEFTMLPQRDATNVIWTMYGPAACMSRLMQVFFNLDQMIGKDFKAGRVNLKKLTEM